MRQMLSDAPSDASTILGRALSPVGEAYVCCGAGGSTQEGKSSLGHSLLCCFYWRRRPEVGLCTEGQIFSHHNAAGLNVNHAGFLDEAFDTLGDRLFVRPGEAVT